MFRFYLIFPIPRHPISFWLCFLLVVDVHSSVTNKFSSGIFNKFCGKSFLFFKWWCVISRRNRRWNIFHRYHKVIIENFFNRTGLRKSLFLNFGPFWRFLQIFEHFYLIDLLHIDRVLKLNDLMLQIIDRFNEILYHIFFF